jgi:hypothetical protein
MKSLTEASGATGKRGPKDSTERSRPQVRRQESLHDGSGCFRWQFDGTDRLMTTTAGENRFARHSEIAHPVDLAEGGEQVAAAAVLGQPDWCRVRFAGHPRANVSRILGGIGTPIRSRRLMILIGRRERKGVIPSTVCPRSGGRAGPGQRCGNAAQRQHHQNQGDDGQGGRRAWA